MMFKRQACLVDFWFVLGLDKSIHYLAFLFARLVLPATSGRYAC